MKAFILVGFAIVSAHGSDTCEPFYGDVVHQKTGKVVFREYYSPSCPEGGKKSLKTVIRNSEGKEVAEQNATETSLPYVFNVDFKDLRDGFEYNIRVKTRDGKEAVQIVSKDDAKAEPKSETITDLNTLMNYSGAMNFIGANLDRLAKGEELKARFIVPSRMDAYSVRFRGKPEKNSQLMSVSIEMSNPLYRAFAPEMNLVFDRQTKSLVRFKGNATLLDENDKPIPVEIEYHPGANGK